MGQVFGFVLFLVAIGVAFWLSFWILVVLFVLGIGMVIWTHLREYLLKKGILNPTPGVPLSAQEAANLPVIDGNFERVEENAPPDERP